MPKTKFLFVRHGQTRRNTTGKLPDGLNEPLNDVGKQQAMETAVNIPKIIDVFITSPLIRAIETGAIICDALGLNPIIEEPDVRLTEVDFGALKGKTWEEATLLHPDEDTEERYKTQEYDFSPHGGDSYESVKERVYSLIEDMKNKYPGKNILVVTHAGIIRCIHKTENGRVFQDVPGNASVHEFEF